LCQERIATRSDSKLFEGAQVVVAWDDLDKREGNEELQSYRKLLVHVGTTGSERVQAVYKDAQTTIKTPVIFNPTAPNFRTMIAGDE
jgi:type I restriction enzyme M protein